uniref:Uncharacterized protein n=1 Tax=Kalanchoe fedtschenkoi TaxID=63787 RepID=A0A7N0TCR6_KALFE
MFKSSLKEATGVLLGCDHEKAMAADGSCESSDSSAADQAILGRRKGLRSCSKAVESDDLSESSQAAEELAGYLDSVSLLVFVRSERRGPEEKRLESSIQLLVFICG